MIKGDEVDYGGIGGETIENRHVQTKLHSPRCSGSLSTGSSGNSTPTKVVAKDIEVDDGGGGAKAKNINLVRAKSFQNI